MKLSSPRRYPLLRSLSLITLSLALTACETQIMAKPGGEHLRAGDAVIMQNGKLSEAESAYRQALASPYPEIRAKAAYNLALLARQNGNTAQYNMYMQKAAESGNTSAQLAVADKFKKQGASGSEEVEKISKPLAETSAAASLNLLEIAHKRNNVEDAKKYAAQTENLILAQVSSSDVDGGKSMMLARLYAEYGKYFSTAKDPERYYRAAIKKGNVKAVEELAQLWMKTGSNRSDADVFALMIQAAEAGDTSAAKYVASAYEEGRGVARDEAKALYWYQKVPGGMKIETLLKLAHASMNSNSAKAATQFAEAGEKGSLEGKMMADGLRKADPVAAAKKYTKENPNSLFSVIKDINEQYGNSHPDMVLHQYKIAAEAGSGKAALKLAQILEGDTTSATNAGEARKWYKRAAELGNGPAMLMLARQAKIGLGQAPNDSEAFKWYEKAAGAGESEGQYETGLAYANGTGVAKDLEKAKFWLEKAKVGGYVLAVEVLKTIGENTESPK